MAVAVVEHEGGALWVDPTQLLPLLESIEELPAHMSGAFIVGEERQVGGMVFVQQRAICWAVTNQMQGRLTDLLIEESSTLATREQIEQLYRRCKQDQRPLGQTLVDEKLVSPTEFRDALCRHTSESLLTLAGCSQPKPRWVEHAHSDYNAQFTFTPAELFISLTRLQRPSLASKADSDLRSNLPEECPGIAFLREGGGTPVAAQNVDTLSAHELLDLGRRLHSAVDIAEVMSPAPRAIALRDQLGGIVAWSHEDLFVAALCRNASEIGYVTSLRKRL